jgi:hypothetical protein
MRTWKHCAFFGIVTIIVVVLTLIACKDSNGEAEQPKDQSEIISGLFDNNTSATVKGKFTDTEWNGVADKIKIALNVRFEESVDGMKIMFNDVFGQEGGVTIIVEKSLSYANYSATPGGKTIYINFAVLNDTSALKLALQHASLVIWGHPDTPMVGKVISPASIKKTV